ncbi:hypothetical protein EX895_003394 [Sporisorium graminicola]|uniref:Uncharacterized protein n=1 Tax=Sporisorium graminicola TaxID=280036 RepID=A0A4U7KTL2_9BASI|nr:hypothetical protein EX895_003394 [Sporisorium graminicola]TKY87813.1 hypothetical protein EX895_003394 [Sporisorium graminicola]
MINPFRKRKPKKGVDTTIPSSPPPTDYASFPYNSSLPPRPGIFIASTPASSRPSQSSQQQQQQATSSAAAGPSSPSASTAHQQSLDHVLPPTSDYRQSLIMPHLTRRFTLLRAPDGSLVSPDAMRAHLRAQRARARAANLAIGSSGPNKIHFLTEDEENEIIDQLKAQARAEGRDFDLERSSNVAAADSWRNGYAAGTDGFGSWGPISSNDPNKLSSLADTLADLSFSHDQMSPQSRKPGGSLFSGRSAERDQAAFRTIKRERNISKPDDPPPPSSSATISSQDTAPFDERQHSDDTARPTLHDDLHDSPMPGGFAARQLPSNTPQPDNASIASKSLLQIPGLGNASRSRTSQDPNLLTTLSPEAFKRVSTALDEVFGLIASERGPSPSVTATSTPEDNHRPPRSSFDSDTNSFTSAVSNVRALDAKLLDPGLAGQSTREQSNRDQDEDDESADRTITVAQPSLDASQIEYGRIAVASPLPGPVPGALPSPQHDSASDMPESHTLTGLPSLVTSDSTQTVRDTSHDAIVSPTGPASLTAPGSSLHLSVSGHSVADSTLSQPSERSSTATATDAQPQSTRVVSTASTIEAPVNRLNDPSARQDSIAAASSSARDPDAYQRSLGSPMQGPASASSSRAQPVHPFRTPEMDSNAFAASPAQSTLSRGDSIVSASSVKSSFTGPSATYQGSHSRKSSADKLALARSMAPHPHLREQPSLSSVRRNYRQHTRSTTGSSEGSLLGGHASRRSSGAMSPPPVLSRSARSPSYFPPPSSTASMHDYASGFKPPSAVSPAAAAALQSMASQANHATQPMQSNVMDASNALRSAQSLRNSASTDRSAAASPHVPSAAAFASGSDRAAATSSPETGGTSISVHKRSTSLTNATKPLALAPSTRISAVEDSLSPTLYAPRPAPAPSIAIQSTMNGHGLMPHPPSDPEQASRWRAVYGTKAADSVSLRASAEDVSTDPNEEEDDFWAKMGSTPGSNNAERPISNFPPSIAEERLAGTGITFDQIADFQDRLIKTANGGEAVPPLPRIQADTRHQNLHQQQKFAEAKSKGLASPNLVLGSDLWGSKPVEDVQATSPTSSAGPNIDTIDTSRDAPVRRSFASSLSREPPVSPRAVMYDVTTSHRPTSPPLHSRNGSLNGLPSLLELNGSLGDRNRDSFSLSQAVAKPSRLPRHPAFQTASIAEDPDSTHDSQYAAAPASQVQEHPYNAGYTSPSLRDNSFTFPRSPKAANVGDSPRHKVQPFPPEDVWDRYGPQQGGATPDLFDTSMSPDSSYLGSDPTRLLDDVAAQTSAATRALKGAHDGIAPTPPFRTKSISRKKSFKKVSKQISSPQLISTTQKLDHATQIPSVLDTPSVSSTTSKRSNRSPGWGSLGSVGFDGSRGHAKASPSGASPMGSFGKSSAYFHRRRSSSFGHDARPNVNLGTPNGNVDGTAASLEQSSSSSGDRATEVHPNHPYMNGGANGGSLSRLFSKIKNRKNDQAFGGATIEPFPPELSAAARASEIYAKQQQAPVTPEMPSLPPVERSTPWTLPRMPSSASSTDRGSSLRSPTSPIYTLPIDSTSMQRSKSKKKRTPIVLKRESEVILPGDEGYLPTAIIGRSPEQRAGEFQAQQAESQAPLDAAHDAGTTTAANAGGSEQQAQLERSTDTTLEADAERMDYCQSRNSGALAPPAAAAAVEEDDKSTTPRPTSPKSTAAAAAAVDEPPEDADKTIDEDADTTLLAVEQSLPKSDEESGAQAHLRERHAQEHARKIGARKSLRDTIVRRTIIIPAGIDFGDQRRSLFGSSRKSRRFAAAEDEPVPNSGDASRSFLADSPAVRNSAALPKLDGEGEQSLNDVEQQASQSLSQEVESGMPPSASQTLHPDSSAVDSTSRSNRASRVESSYAGSLYDMYIGGGGDNNVVEFGSPGSDVYDLPVSGAPRSGVPAASRASRMPETRRHIEVTERADGSVVWQVIAGLAADRGSVYSDFEPRHSRHLSDASAGAAGLLDGPPFRTPAGLTDDDSRSFFTRPNAGRAVGAVQHHPAFSLDTNEPLPTRQAGNGANGQRAGQDVFEIANPSPVDRNLFSPSTSAVESTSLDSTHDPTAPVATSAVATPAASATRIVYHNDAQLASLLDVLAKGKDSAKFEFHTGPRSAHLYRQSVMPNGEGGHTTQDTTMSREVWDSSGLLDANDIESHRSRVEAEIYTLLNRHAVVGGGE